MLTTIQIRIFAKHDLLRNGPRPYIEFREICPIAVDFSNQEPLQNVERVLGNANDIEKEWAGSYPVTATLKTPKGVKEAEVKLQIGATLPNTYLLY